MLPTLLEDIIGKADKWGSNGKIDPFVEIYDVRASFTTEYVSLDAEFSLSARFRHDRSIDNVQRLGEK